MAMSPDGRQLATVTQNSVHCFSLENLSILKVIDTRQILLDLPFGTKRKPFAVGMDGLLHYRGQNQSVPQVTAVGAFGEMRAIVHQNIVAIWRNDHDRIVSRKNTR